jgi:hypothetical protein
VRSGISRIAQDFDIPHPSLAPGRSPGFRVLGKKIQGIDHLNLFEICKLVSPTGAIQIRACIQPCRGS